MSFEYDAQRLAGRRHLPLDLGSSELGPLTSNGCALPRNTKYLGQLSSMDSSAFSSSSARESFTRDGYLLVRGALPRESVLRVREAYFQLFDPIILREGDARRGEFSGQMPEGLPQHG